MKICVCGHDEKKHRLPTNSYIYCQECFLLKWDKYNYQLNESVFSACLTFKLDNLKYLENKYEQSIR